MNSIETLPNLKQRLLIRRYKPLLYLTFLLFLPLILAALVFLVVKPYFNLALDHGITPQFIAEVLRDRDAAVRQTDHRTNILVLGISGGTHDGPDLTDAILVISIDWSNSQKSAIFSLPRDVWSPTLKDKINTAYHYGQEKRKGGGITLSKSIIREVIGLPIHYSMVVDFSEFIRLVDILGGIDVDVKTAFDDYDFPISGRENDLCHGDIHYRCRYKHIRFEVGHQYMDGERALEFVRSRHASDNEGTDYARSERQPAVLLALRNKLLDKRLFVDPTKLRQLLVVYDTSVQSDFQLADFLLLGKVLKEKKPETFERITIPSEGKVRTSSDLLIVAPQYQYEGRWVLIPRTGSFDEMQKYLECKLSLDACPGKEINVSR